MKDGQRICFVEAGGERIIEGAGLIAGVRASRVEPQSRRAHRQHHGDGVILIPWSQRLDAAQQKVVGEGSAGAQHLRAADDDAAIGLLADARGKIRLGLLVRTLGAVDLRLDDRVGNIQMIVARLLVELGHMVAKLPAVTCEDLRGTGEAREKAGDMIRRATHEAIGGVRPPADHRAALPQILDGTGHHVAAQHRLARLRRGVGHLVALLGGQIIESGDGARSRRKRGMPGDIADPLAVEVDLSPVTQAFQVVHARAHHVTSCRTVGSA